MKKKVTISFRLNFQNTLWWLAYGCLFQYLAYDPKPLSEFGLAEIVHICFWLFFLIGWIFWYAVIPCFAILVIWGIGTLWDEHKNKQYRKAIMRNIKKSHGMSGKWRS